MRKLAIVHFNPIEKYPPALNWLNFIASHSPGTIEVKVFTMRPDNSWELFVPGSDNIRIIRSGKQGDANPLRRYINYGLFYAGTLLRLIGWRPDTILYFETLSAFPPLFYKTYFGRRSKLFIHYHEYTTIKEYQESMRLSAWQHGIERKSYAAADWISHTNEDRIRLFKEDLAWVSLPAVRCLPNYPPSSWYDGPSVRQRPGKPLKIVCVGAIGLETMYTKEFAVWVISQGGEVIWDIYTNNISPDAREYLEGLDSEWIRLQPAVNYFLLPQTLANYDVGVVLYNGFIPNYTFNVPNKLYEYIACGLDTWFPDKLISSLALVNEGVYPRIISLDFTRLHEFGWRAATDRSGLTFRSPGFRAEEVLERPWRKMLEQKNV
jgi:hypothetical protein